MQTKSYGHNKMKSFGLSLALIVLLWFAGACVGFLVYRQADSAFSSMMRGALERSVSIVSLLPVVFFPFVITAYAVIYSKPVLIYMLCFGKAVLYAVCSLSVYRAFGPAGWLAQILVMFSDNCTTVVLWLLWLKSLSKPSGFSRSVFYAGLAFCVLAGMLDVFLISPFAVSLTI